MALALTNVFASHDYGAILESFKKVCLEESFEKCEESMIGAAENKALFMDALKLMRLNKQFSELYIASFGEDAYQEFNEAFKISITFINFDDYNLKASTKHEVVFQDTGDHSLVFTLIDQRWKLDIESSMAGGSMQPMKQFIKNSIGAHLSLISKIKNASKVDEVYKLGGRYFVVVIYDYSDAESKAQLDRIFEEKNIDVESLREDMATFYKNFPKS